MTHPDLLLHVPFADSFDAAYARGNPEGIVDPRGIGPELVDAGAYFGWIACARYYTEKNFNREAGTVMMWFRPEWDADFDDMLGRILWDVRIETGSSVSDDPSQRWAIVYPNPLGKKLSDRPASTLECWRFCIATDRNLFESGSSRPRRDERSRQALFGSHQSFSAGDWMHLAATWTEEEAALFIDGKEDVREELRDGLPWRQLPETMQVGALATWMNAGAEGVISDFRVYGNALDGETIRDEAEIK